MPGLKKNKIRIKLIQDIPAGDVTLSLNLAGCSPVVKTIPAAPDTVFAANFNAISLDIPIRTAPSARASITKYTYWKEWEKEKRNNFCFLLHSYKIVVFEITILNYDSVWLILFERK